MQGNAHTSRITHHTPRITHHPYGLGITVLLIAFVLLGLTYSIITPIFEAPDEPWHFNYVRYVAEGRGLPSLLNNDSGAYQEVGQPPLYYLVAGLVIAPIQPQDMRGLTWHNPGFGYKAPGTVNDNKNLLIHTEQELPGALLQIRNPKPPQEGDSEIRNSLLAIHLARLVSLAFGALTVLSTWGLAREVFPGVAFIVLAAAALVALTPQFVFMSSVTSNDSSAAALSTATLWAIARMWRLGVTTRRAALTGLLIGLASLTKTSTILLGVFAVAVVLVSQDMRPFPFTPFRVTWRSCLRDVLVMAMVALAIGGWWYARNGLLYGDPLGLSVHLNTPWARPAQISLSEVIPSLPLMYRSFWGAFGWGNVEMSPVIYCVIAAVFVASLVGWIADWLKARRISCDLRLVICLLWCGAIFVSLLRWNQQVEAPHGRLLFPMIGAFAVLFVAGLSRLPRPRVVLGIIIAGFWVLSLAAPFVYIRPAYAQPELLLPDQTVARQSPSLGGPSLVTRHLLYGSEAQLIGFALDRPFASPGEWLNVALCWTAVHPMTRDYTLFVHLLGRENLVVGARNTWPGLGRFPTSLWPVGRAFCDTVPVHVETWTPAPEMYAVEVGLYDTKTDDRLEAADESGAPVVPSILGRVRIVPAQPLRVSPQHVTQADFAGQAVLIGFDAPAQARPGGRLPLQLYWRAASPMREDYTVFVHLLDGSGKLVAQADSQPRGSAYPTSAWAVGDVIPDDHALTLPADLAPGDYTMRVGLYLAPNGPRLPLKSSRDDAIVLGVLQVIR